MPLHPLVVMQSAMVAHLISLNFDSFQGNEQVTGNSWTRRFASGNLPSRFHGGHNAGHKSTQKHAIDQSLITCSLVTGRALRLGEVSTSGRASLLVISALLNFSL